MQENKRNVDINNKAYMTLQAMNQWYVTTCASASAQIVYFESCVIVRVQSPKD